MKPLAKESYDKETSLAQAFLRKYLRKLKLTRPSLKWYMGSNSWKRLFEDDSQGSSLFLAKALPPLPQAQYRGSNTSSQNQLTTNKNRDSPASSTATQTTQSYIADRESLQLLRQLEADNIGSLGPMVIRI